MISALKRHKAAGENGITPELYKGGNEIPINYLINLVTRIRHQKIVSHDRMQSSYKKEKCNKYGNHCLNNFINLVANIMTAFS